MSYNPNLINQEVRGWDNGEFFGQWQTDKIIKSYFPENYKGVCVEVGAADGIKGSNSLYFEQKNWDVLCIEPNPIHFSSLEKHRKNVIRYGCGNKEGTFPLTVFVVGENNITTSLTSLNPDERLVESHKDLINDTYQVDVNVQTLSWILDNETKGTIFENKTKIDFISIDTEGTEIDVLKGFDFDKYDVTLFVVENNYNDSDIFNFMETKGYVRDQRYKINDFFIRK